MTSAQIEKFLFEISSHRQKVQGPKDEIISWFAMPLDAPITQWLAGIRIKMRWSSSAADPQWNSCWFSLLLASPNNRGSTSKEFRENWTNAAFFTNSLRLARVLAQRLDSKASKSFVYSKFNLTCRTFNLQMLPEEGTQVTCIGPAMAIAAKITQTDSKKAKEKGKGRLCWRWRSRKI